MTSSRLHCKQVAVARARNKYCVLSMMASVGDGRGMRDAAFVGVFAGRRRWLVDQVTVEALLERIA